jgi:hypothetical protein
MTLEKMIEILDSPVVFSIYQENRYEPIAEHCTVDDLLYTKIIGWLDYKIFFILKGEGEDDIKIVLCGDSLPPRFSSGVDA